MSAEHPYVMRVFWDNGRGFARHIGVYRALEVQPVIEGLPRWNMLDWIPHVVAMIQPHAERVRDLDLHEQRCVARWLESFRRLW